MVVLLALAGFWIAPAAAITFTLIGRLVPEPAVTEAFTWLSTGVIAGFALGGAATGVIVQGVSVPAALAATAAFAFSGALVIFARRATLVSGWAVLSAPHYPMRMRPARGYCCSNQ
jgi:hypothetical protein